MWPGDTCHTTYTAITFTLDEIGEGIDATIGGGHHQGGDERCNSAILFRNHR